MVRLFGSIERNTVEQGRQVMVFRVPAVSKRVARARGRANAKLKGLEQISVSSAEKAGSGSFPGQSIYEVTVTAPAV